MNLKEIKMHNVMHKLTEDITFKKIFIIMLGAAILSFGIHNIHQRVNITEGGVIGLMLLIEHWFNLSPALITPILDGLCYLVAFKILGWNFMKLSIISTSFISLFYKLWESMPYQFMDMSSYQFLQQLLGDYLWVLALV